MSDEQYRIGELAQAAGVTVRALHHYDRLGLLVPSERTHGGHRLYTAADVQRLYRLLALRELGLPLGRDRRRARRRRRALRHRAPASRARGAQA